MTLWHPSGMQCILNPTSGGLRPPATLCDHFVIERRIHLRQCAAHEEIPAAVDEVTSPEPMGLVTSSTTGKFSVAVHLMVGLVSLGPPYTILVDIPS